MLCIPIDVGDSSLLLGSRVTLIPSCDPGAVADAQAPAFEETPRRGRALKQAAHECKLSLPGIDQTVARYQAKHLGVLNAKSSRESTRTWQYILMIDKLESLRDIFGTREVDLRDRYLVVNGCSYPIVNDVVILLDPAQYPRSLSMHLQKSESRPNPALSDFAEDIQFTFGEEWQRFPRILPDHEEEFAQYFDLVDVKRLEGARVCDLGCGTGRWSYFLAPNCRELVLVDFSEAIFVARRNLSHVRNTLFFMADLKALPFRNDFADFLCSLGVLHHLPTPALEEVRALAKYAPRLLIYVYYALDNRPAYFRLLLSLVTKLRLKTATLKSPAFRSTFSWFGVIGMYLPLLVLGSALRPLRLSHLVPLYEAYRGKGFERIRQDVYDRFFTRIEQRHTRRQILELEDTFSRVIISEKLPYWHFLCER